MLFHRLSLRRRRLTLILLVVLAIAGVGLTFIHPAVAADTLQQTAASGNPLGEAIFLILNTILWGMTKLFSMMTFIFVSILVIVARYNTFLNAPVVQSGWPIVRDLMNMLFIIALIIIAAGTVLRLQNYRYNRLLGKLIIMALLVNFSKFIAVFLLQFAQVVMLTFVNAFREAAFGNFSSMFGLDSVFQFSSTGTTGGGGFSIFISMIAGLAMMIVAFVVTLSMTVMLFVRIIALWLLIILSPIAYAMRILPNTEKYASQWWAEFTKYAVLGPVLAFFLWLALAVVAATPSCSQPGCNNPLGTDPAVKADMASVDADQTKSGVRGDLVTNILSVDKMVTFVVSIIFLMMGMQYAQKSGAAGAAFAGKVASAGFGAFAGITGYNMIKDRTVAPIQGWLKNRSAARQSAIQERTETVEAAGDRVKGRFGLTQGARERGTAAANAYERNRTARTAQKQGYKDMDDEDLQGKFQTSTNQRERLAAMTELSNRGHIDLNDEDQNKAFEDLTNYQRERKLGFLPAYPLADAELPKGERQQLREKILDQNIKSQDEATLRRHASMKDDDPTKDAALRDRRIRSTQELDRRQLLKANDDGDAGLVSQLENDVRGIPEKHRQFKENLMKSSPDMAMRVLFNNLERPKHVAGDRADEARADLKHRENMEAYKSAIQQRQISTSSMSKGLYDSLGTGPEGLKVKKELAQHLIDISPDAETLQSYWKGMDSEAAHMFGKHIDMGDDPNVDRRNMAAKVTGEWGRAFQDGDGNPLYMGKDGKPMTQAAATADPSKVEKDDKERPVLLGQDYFDKLGGDEVLKTLTPEAIKSARVQEMMRRSPNWTFSNSATLRTRSAESREAQTVGLQAGMAEILTRHSGAQDPLTGKIDFAKITNENEKAEVISMAQQLFLASKGATNPYDMTKGSDGAKLFASTISGAKAADYSKIAKSVDYDKGSEQYKKDVHVAIGRNGKPGELSDLLLMDREFTEEVLKDTQQVLKEELNGDEDTAGKAHNVLRRLANQEGFNNIISYTPSEYRGKSSESEKGSAGEKATDGGKKAAAATVAGAAGAVIGAVAGSRAAREAAAAEPWKAGAKIVLPPGVSIDDDEPEGPDEPPTPPNTPPPTPPPPTGGSTPPSTPPAPPGGGASAPVRPLTRENNFGSEEAKVGFVRDRYLSYQDAPLPEGIKRQTLERNYSSASAIKYAQGLLDLEEKHGTAAVLQVSQDVQEKMQAGLDALEIPASPYGQSQSWAMWDLGKQQHYVNHPTEQDPKYTAVDPLTSQEKQQEIIDRHVGWEAHNAFKRGDDTFLKKIETSKQHPEVTEIINREQLSSKDLAELGEKLRLAASSTKPATSTPPSSPTPTGTPAPSTTSERTTTKPHTPSAQESPRSIDDVLTQLATAQAEDMAGIREALEDHVKSLQQATTGAITDSSKALRERLNHLSVGPASSADHETQKRLFREFGEELKRTMPKNTSGTTTTRTAPTSTTSRPTKSSKPPKPTA